MWVLIENPVDFKAREGYILYTEEFDEISRTKMAFEGCRGRTAGFCV